MSSIIEYGQYWNASEQMLSDLAEFARVNVLLHVFDVAGFGEITENQCGFPLFELLCDFDELCDDCRCSICLFSLECRCSSCSVCCEWRCSICCICLSL